MVANTSSLRAPVEVLAQPDRAQELRSRTYYMSWAWLGFLHSLSLVSQSSQLFLRPLTSTRTAIVTSFGGAVKAVAYHTVAFGELSFLLSITAAAGTGTPHLDIALLPGPSGMTLSALPAGAGTTPAFRASPSLRLRFPVLRLGRYTEKIKYKSNVGPHTFGGSPGHAVC
ncbi:unnamed protein product [Rhizoctonia solani]|uniref:Uncharacterized protein n=1 Tax=Rhizoctonia solani TaxID=456999 RepID=A0A8H3A3X2_9AGAM|nr:unnamed protein product [Rhizoctonia solani]